MTAYSIFSDTIYNNITYPLNNGHIAEVDIDRLNGFPVPILPRNNEVRVVFTPLSKTAGIMVPTSFSAENETHPDFFHHRVHDTHLIQEKISPSLEDYRFCVMNKTNLMKMASDVASLVDGIKDELICKDWIVTYFFDEKGFYSG